MYSTILELASIHSSAHNLYRVFLLLEEGLWLHDSVVYEQFPFWCCIEKEDFMQAEGSSDRATGLGWVVSKTQECTKLKTKHPDIDTDLNDYTQSTFFLYMCVREKGGGK